MSVVTVTCLMGQTSWPTSGLDTDLNILGSIVLLLHEHVPFRHHFLGPANQLHPHLGGMGVNQRMTL